MDSLPHGPTSYDPRRVFLFDFPKLKLGPKKKEIGVYAAGALVSTRGVRGEHSRGKTLIVVLSCFGSVRYRMVGPSSSLRGLTDILTLGCYWHWLY
jgi:hypothetical protein